MEQNIHQEKAAASPFEVILFYKYTAVESPEALRKEQFYLCKKYGLLGRVIVAFEGINAILEGSKEDLDLYSQEVKSDPRFANVHFKRSVGTGRSFPRLSVKVRPEIVASYLGEEDINPTEFTGERISPDELHQWFEKNENFSIIDMRNEYEYAVGRFEKTIGSGMEHFRDLKDIVNNFVHMKDQKVVTVCTGGVRCEKASGYLKSKGFQNVFQLDGGIHSYIEKYPGKYFKGSLYTFDGRNTYTFDHSQEHDVIGKCAKCNASCETFADCLLDECSNHFLCCGDCFEITGKAYCSLFCKAREMGKTVRRMLSW